MTQTLGSLAAENGVSQLSISDAVMEFTGVRVEVDPIL
jgi:hypothetical protein